MSEKRICPLMSIHAAMYEDCVKDRCEWWDFEQGCCSVLSLALNIGEIKECYTQ